MEGDSEGDSVGLIDGTSEPCVGVSDGAVDEDGCVEGASLGDVDGALDTLGAADFEGESDGWEETEGA